MSDYDNTNRGALFKNEKTKDSQPDYTGKIDFEGTEYRITSWIKTSKNGKPFMSLSVEKLEGEGAAAPAAPAAQDFSQDIPF